MFPVKYLLASYAVGAVASVHIFSQPLSPCELITDRVIFGAAAFGASPVAAPIYVYYGLTALEKKIRGLKD